MLIPLCDRSRIADHTHRIVSQNGWNVFKSNKALGTVYVQSSLDRRWAGRQHSIEAPYPARSLWQAREVIRTKPRICACALGQAALHGHLSMDMHDNIAMPALVFREGESKV